MLRNDYLYKYKEKSQYEAESKYAQDDDNYLLQSYRPLSEKSLTKIPKDSLRHLVDEVLNNKMISTVLFSTNARSEIKLTERSKRFMQLNSIKTREKKITNNPNDIVINRKKKEEIINIKNETDRFKDNKNKHKQELTDKNNDFFKSLKTLRKSEHIQVINNLNSTRKDRFEKIFISIKDKLENYYENARTNRTKIIFRDHTIKLDRFSLPDVKLDIHDVYSRLYHNAVYIFPKVEIENADNMKLNNTNGENTPKGYKPKETKFVVKNVIESTNGKEFTIKVTDEILQKCFTHHSGGPSIQIEDFNFNPALANKDNEYYINLLEMRDDYGNTILHNSIIENHPDLVLYLLYKGVDVDVQNRDGDTPLHIAMRTNQKDVL